MASDLTGCKFGRLKVLSRASVHTSAGGTKTYRYNCRCDCGVELVVRMPNLSSGNTTSCGCHQKEGLALRRTTHGASHTPEHTSWDGMVRRCTDSNLKAYHNYGGRGIMVCDRWLTSFENFLQDMGPRPEGTSLDRKDNDGNYCKENCRWATAQEQAWNKRSVVLYAHAGESLPSSVWAKRLGLPQRTLYRKLRADSAYLDKLLKAN